MQPQQPPRLSIFRRKPSAFRLVSSALCISVHLLEDWKHSARPGRGSSRTISTFSTILHSVALDCTTVNGVPCNY
jgi:hypothetical protein